MRNITPNNGDSLIHSPEIGHIKTAKDVLKHRKKLSKAPADIQVAAAWLLLSETDWSTLLPQYVTECVTDAKPKASKKLDATMNFIRGALTARMWEMKEEGEATEPKHRNN